MIDVASRQPFTSVAVSLDPGATVANRNLRMALALEGCQVLDIAPAELARRLPDLGGCLILIYDASPGNETVAATIRECWLRFPDLPVLLYVPAAPHIGAILT